MDAVRAPVFPRILRGQCKGDETQEEQMRRINGVEYILRQVLVVVSRHGLSVIARTPMAGRSHFHGTLLFARRGLCKSDKFKNV